MNSHEKPGPFPFPERPNVRRWYPDDIVIPEELKPSPSSPVRRRKGGRKPKKEEKKSYNVMNIIQGEDDVFEMGEEDFLSVQQIENVIFYIKSCCRNETTAEVTLSELEAAFRRHKYAIYSKDTEIHCRGLMESLEFLLQENNLSVEAWFRMSDVRGGIGGDGKVTHLELIESITQLCRRLDIPCWDKRDIQELLRYMDPSGDSDISLVESELAFRKYHSPPEYQAILDAATPLISKLGDFMSSRHIRVIDLFRSIDSDNSSTISFRELQRALQKMFGSREDRLQLSSRQHRRKQLLEVEKAEAQEFTIDNDSCSSGWSKFNKMLVKFKPKIPDDILFPKNKFKGHVNNNVDFSSPNGNNNKYYSDYDDRSTNSIMSALSVESNSVRSVEGGSSVGGSKSVASHLSQRSSYSTYVKRNSQKLQPLELSKSSFKKMLEIMKLSGIDIDSIDRNSIISKEPTIIAKVPKKVSSDNNGSQRKKHLQLNEAHYMHRSHPIGLEGDAVDVSGPHFQKRLKADLLKLEASAGRLTKSLNMEKRRLEAI